MPYDISKFFFFDAEDIKSIAEKQGGEEVKESVELILGVKTIRKTIDDLNSVKKEFENERNKILSDSREYEELNTKLKEISKQIDEKEKKLEEIKNKIKDLNTKRNKLRAQLADNSIQEVREFESRRKKLEEKIARLNSDKQKIKDEIKELSSNIHLLILRSVIKYHLENIEIKLKEVSKQRGELGNIRDRMILLEKLIKENKCPVCGKLVLSRDAEIHQQELEELKKEYSNLPKTRKTIEDKYVRISIRYKKLKEKLEEIDKIRPEALFELRGKFQQMDTDIKTAEKDKAQISKKLENFGVSLVSQLETKISEITAKITEAEEEEKRLKKELDESRKDERTTNHKLDILAPSNSLLGGIQRKLQVLSSLEDALTEYIHKLIELRREELITEASNVFLKLTNKKEEYEKFEFSSESNYKFQIICKDGSKPDMNKISYGEKEVVALSFILGLNKYSLIKAPIITDTLFGRLSPYVQENLAILFSNAESQIILLVLKDMRENGKTEIDHLAPWLKDKIYNEYLILRDQNKRVSHIEKVKIFEGE
ncbi:MAG TPA: hypothetical protein ENI51_00805 [Candidatus Atribacteria bacterium]|nr:hypothetical protein [Candidatus Atribacteria bacterium]